MKTEQTSEIIRIFILAFETYWSFRSGLPKMRSLGNSISITYKLAKNAKPQLHFILTESGSP
jgi:hypothetical protein